MMQELHLRGLGPFNPRDNTVVCGTECFTLLIFMTSDLLM